MILFGRFAEKPVRRIKRSTPGLRAMRADIILKRKRLLTELALDAIKDGARDHTIQDAFVFTVWKRDQVTLWPGPAGAVMFYRGEHVATFEDEHEVTVRLGRALRAARTSSVQAAG